MQHTEWEELGLKRRPWISDGWRQGSVDSEGYDNISDADKSRTNKEKRENIGDTIMYRSRHRRWSDVG